MTGSTYSRRTFFKAAGLLTGALLLTPNLDRGTGNSLDTFVGALGKQYKGTRDGLVFESVDSGKTWQQVANFGKHCSIAAISERQKQIYADVVVQGYHFSLRSVNARVWYTVS